MNEVILKVCGLMGNFNDLFKNELINGEKVLWSGEPDAGIMLTKIDLLLVKFALL